MNTVIERTAPSELKNWRNAASDLFADKKREGYEAVGLHLYRTADGAIQHARVRMHRMMPDGGHEKFIRPFHHDGVRWKLGEPAQASGKMLYGLHELAQNPYATVVVTEGEQKADVLTSIGEGRFIAVTSGSATSAGSADWSPLADRHVLLWPDNDAPGQKYADEVADRLAAQCTILRIVVAELDLPDGGDAVDWFDRERAVHGREPTADDVLSLPMVVMGTPAHIAESDEQVIARLAALAPIQYDRVRRTEAKCMGVQVSTLDRMVAAGRTGDGEDAGPFETVEPWHEPVDGAVLLDELVRVVRRFIVCCEATAHGCALWIAMTWLMESVDVAPIAAITAPEKRCGKSQLLFLIGRLSSRPLAASNITPAALFRAIELWRPTLLIDEADTFMNENDELRGLLNCGHTRDSAYVVRTVGDDHTPKQFSTWGAKAIASIGQLADTLTDRSIPLRLRRKLPHEQADKLRHAEPGLFERLRARLARWADDNADTVRAAHPDLPDALHDRAADNWEPLFQIAGVAGGAWPELARKAALTLSGDLEESQSTGVELLADIQEVFETRRVLRISSADLLGALCEDEEKSWATWNRGKPMSPRQLAKRLADYDIRSKNIRSGYSVTKGYDSAQFGEAFARYLSSPDSAATTLQPNANKAHSVADDLLHHDGDLPDATPESLPDMACSGVADKNGLAVGKANVDDDGAETWGTL
ncbi:DUF3631 domain-containing protein [Paraburkholderia terrae]|uniref:DUF3631 domain-containing protein n=1 Tax=Paraburkholderia terrae TaxID=311230 RepID=UPI00296A9870|nr:DUF3631 domain-containing protein [Paraburkholderia terrae]MDW3660381.1 DUF3631 domain-containing protein [Paraburkholderia terrae]